MLVDGQMTLQASRTCVSVGKSRWSFYSISSVTLTQGLMSEYGILTNYTEGVCCPTQEVDESKGSNQQLEGCV